jgi:hypothetical protein
MVATDPIKLAQETVGADTDTDYVIDPTAHADEFKVKAPALSAVLRSSGVSVAAKRYKERDSDANVSQVEFKRVFNRSNVTVLITAILIALVLATGIIAPGQGDKVAKTLLIILGVASVLTGSLAAYDLNTLRQGKLLGVWMSNRALAETARLEYFNIIARSSVADGAGDTQVDLLKLEYFRRFQLDVQRNYYRQRSIENLKDAKRILAYSGIAIAGAAVVTGLAGFLGLINTKFAAFASLGTAFTALTSFAAANESVYQNQRNAERYQRTGEALEGIASSLDDVRTAVQAAGAEPLMGFIEAVHEQLSLEHRQWLGQQTEGENAFTRLQDTLTKISTRPSGKSASGG